MRAEPAHADRTTVPSGPHVVPTADDAVTVEVWCRADLLAVADDPIAEMPVRALRLVCHGWRPPTPSWTGSLGHVPGVRELHVVVGDDENGGGARIEITLHWVRPASELVAAVHSWLYPTLRRSRASSPALAAEPGGAAGASAAAGRPVGPLAPEPEGFALPAADAVLTTAQDLERPGDGATRAADGFALTIDLAVHRPVGRLDPWADGDRLRLARDVAGWHLAGGTSDHRFDLDRALDEHDVARLTRVEAIDLSAADRTPGLAAHLAGLAATGVVLHDAAAAALTGWPDELIDVVRGPYTSTRGLQRELRSLAQRRAALAAFDPARHQRALDDDRQPEVSVLLVSRRPDLATRVVAMMAAQHHRRLEVVVVMHGVPPMDLAQLDPGERDRVTVNRSVPAQLSFGEALAAAVTAASGELLTKVDDDDHYGPHHVGDLVMTRRYSGATLVGRRADHVYLEALGVTIDRSAPSEKYGAPVAGGTMMLSRADLLDVGGWRPVARSVDRALHQQVLDAGGLVYIGSGVGYLYVRHDLGHTWHQPVAPFLQAARAQRDGVRLDVLG